MVLYWFCSQNQKDEEEARVVGFISRAMGWIFRCCRVKHSSNSPEPVLSRNALSSLFLSNEDSISKGEEIRNPLPEGLDVRELKAEAKFLKACGTLAETPAEIRKASAKWGDISAQGRDEKSSKSNSWLHNASSETLKLEKQFDESPPAVKINEELENTPSSCMTDTRRGSISSVQSSNIQSVITPLNVHDSETHSANSSLSSSVFTPSVQCKNKSVHFDLDSHGCAFSSKGSSSDNASQQSKHSKQSPYPTPLKLNNEMQTPGTVFPSYTNNMPAGKTNRIRSQYVYSAMNPVENLSQSIESINVNDETMKNVSVGKEVENEASRLKDVDKELFGSDSCKNIVLGRTPGDRPILGMVAAHWNDEEISHISPKWWGGNGIPNSTNKYKEDQKVSWHATPFEERLEKALSEETFISQRKPICGTPPIEFDESQESDTAFSHLQSSPHSKSVVSF